MTNTTTTYGEGWTQEEMMKKDECIVVDGTDLIVGHGSKYDVHTVNSSTPRGKLHRAFSVFLFNSEGKLLLQQRAADKITFPNVWTNTCCSHPLYGYNPTEVDENEDISNGSVPGAKRAAIRKLNHELGVSFDALETSDFKFLTRLHYYAADVVTHGPNSPWCEHEVDYILFVQKDVAISPNPEEVGGVRYVTLSELQAMMDPSSGLLWSPWFRIIAEKFLVHWWSNLETTLTTNVFTNFTTIYKCVPETGELEEVVANNARSHKADKKSKGNGNDDSIKQGAYGKVKIHKHSLLSQLVHVDEVAMAIHLLVSEKFASKLDSKDVDVRFCNDMLGRVSRSFAGVIRQLPGGLYLDILMFYLILRALDTVEDDMDIFLHRNDIKVKMLCDFYRTTMVIPSDQYRLWSIGHGDERALLQKYNHCVQVFNSLPDASREIIADITKRMGAGMASFVSRDLGQGTVSVADYDLYCHYVAGLVGEGLSELFHASGYESVAVKNVSKTKANTMGLFLQKTNIIRDYLEDYCDGRTFWPQEIWKQYTTSNDLGELRDPANQTKALHCLNHMILNALECIPECLEYMQLLRHKQIFNFCAIPQVMAIATLADIYNNPQVFTGVVKIRKGLAVKMIYETTDMVNLHKWFYVLTKRIYENIPEKDPNAERTRELCKKILRLTQQRAMIGIVRAYLKVAGWVAAVMLAYAAFVLSPLVVDEQGQFGTSVLLFRNFGSLAINHATALVCFYVGVAIILISATVEASTNWNQ